MPLISEQLDELRQEFLASVPRRLQEVAQLAHQAEQGDRGALRQLQLRAHTLVGSAGIYGFHDLSKKAKELELFVSLMLEDTTTEEDSPPQFMWRYITQFVRDLQALERGLVAQVEDTVEVPLFFESIAFDQQLILYVTDDELGGRGISAMLMDFGHLVELCLPGEAARKIELLHPDFVFLSLATSQIDGRELARKIRSKQLGKYLPIIFLTSRHDVDTYVSCIAAGADDVVHKPFNPQMLLSKMFALKRIIEQRSDDAAKPAEP